MSRPKIVIKSKSGEKEVPKEQAPVPERREGQDAENKSTKEVPSSNPAKKSILERYGAVAQTSIETPSNEIQDLVEKQDSGKTGPKTRSNNQRSWLPIAGIGAIGILLIGTLIWYFFYYNSKEIVNDDMVNSLSSEVPNIVPTLSENKYEQEYQDFEKEILSSSTSVRELLNTLGIAGADIPTISRKLNKMNLPSLRKGDRYTTFFQDEVPAILIIEPKSTPYYKYEINFSSLEVKKRQKERVVKTNEMAAIVETNLGITFINNNLNLKLINKIEEVFQYSLDLFQLDDGDRFKILYETEYLDGKPYEVLGIKAAFIQEGSRKYYAFRQKEGRKFVYFNELGESMKRFFLSSPIKYGGVISSGYGLRIHPKTGHQKMHLGTDYAAPEGTPIVATADGIVTGRAFAGDSGNFVKLKHDDNFETQYLHMQKFEPSVTIGSRVKQGDVIGYVGSTGSSTGPHVCYRFKKSGDQVDPLEHNKGTSAGVPSSEYQDYLDYTDKIKSHLRKIDYF